MVCNLASQDKEEYPDLAFSTTDWNSFKCGIMKGLKDECEEGL